MNHLNKAIIAAAIAFISIPCYASKRKEKADLEYEIQEASSIFNMFRNSCFARKYISKRKNSQRLTRSKNPKRYNKSHNFKHKKKARNKRRKCIEKWKRKQKKKQKRNEKNVK